MFSWNHPKIVSCFVRCVWILFTVLSSNLCIPFSNLSVQDQWISFVDNGLHVICKICPDSVCIPSRCGIIEERDKCHQFRNAIAHLNEAAGGTFIHSKDISFDKGSVPSRSSYNTVRQYNNSKPDKCQTNFYPC